MSPLQSAERTDLTGIDPVTGDMVVEGVTAVGRTTVKLLAMNDTRRIERRELLERRPHESLDS